MDEKLEELIKTLNDDVKKIFACDCCYKEQFEAANQMARESIMKAYSFGLGQCISMLEQLKNSLEIIDASKDN